MTNSERITAHNARLAAMKETVAALPEAGGGGSVETCTVTITNSFSGGIKIWGTNIVDGEITLVNTSIYSGDSVTLDSAVCGSALCIGSNNLQSWTSSNTGIYPSESIQGAFRVYEIPYDVNSATIVVRASLDEF